MGAGITAVLLLVVIALQGTAPEARPAAVVVLAVIVASFMLGSLGGVGRTWQGALYRAVIAPRLGPPAELEDPRPPRFAQTVGLVITGAGLALAAIGIPYAVLISSALAFVAAFLNAVFGLCLGCEMYTALARLRRRISTSTP